MSCFLPPMLRITKQTDYGIVLMTCFAIDEAGRVQNARDVARDTNLPLPTVSKILKALARGGVLISHRGVKGGYSLARSPEAITIDAEPREIHAPRGDHHRGDHHGAGGPDRHHRLLRRRLRLRHRALLPGARPLAAHQRGGGRRAARHPALGDGGGHDPGAAPGRVGVARDGGLG